MSNHDRHPAKHNEKLDKFSQNNGYQNESISSDSSRNSNSGNSNRTKSPNPLDHIGNKHNTRQSSRSNAENASTPENFIKKMDSNSRDLHPYIPLTVLELFDQDHPNPNSNISDKKFSKNLKIETLEISNESEMECSNYENLYNIRAAEAEPTLDEDHSRYENTSSGAEHIQITLNEVPGTNFCRETCVMIKENGIRGVIKWIGCIQSGDESTIWVGIEADEKLNYDNSVNWDIHKKFSKPFSVDREKVIYVTASEIEDDPRYKDSMSYQHLVNDLDEPPSVKEYRPILGRPALPALNISKPEDLRQICGKFKGIQGHHNSCYLDATVFSMFAFTNILDSELLNKEFKNDDFPRYDFQRILREKIVNPLRIQGYVPWQMVMELREILDREESGYTKEEKDPEEFLNMLFVKVFHADPLLKLNSGQGSFFYQLFVEKDDRLTFPTVQQLFDQSFSSSDVKLTEIPSCLIIQMPRFGNKYKMYPHILPSHLLDITDILEQSPRQCTLCGKLAEQECIDCFNTANEVSLETSTFCQDCFSVYHQHEKRKTHSKIKKINNKCEPIETFKKMHRCNVERIYMELFAVVCIETSHYVSFVKTGSEPKSSWCFFDSMADRKGGVNGYNIPELTHEEEISSFLSEDNINFQKLTKQAKRLLGDAYMCMYKCENMARYK